MHTMTSSSIEIRLSAVKYLALKIQNEYRSFRKLPAASPLPLHRVKIRKSFPARGATNR
jgi:hypothetical protein